MSKSLRIVIVGKSPLSFYLSQQLDKYLGDLVQYQLLWLTDDETLVTDFLSFDPNGAIKSNNLRKSFKYVDVKVTQIKSINLRTQEIITSRGSVSYDFLILDQVPYYNNKELSTIYRQFSKLVGVIAAAKRGEKPITAVATIGGSSASSWQLALALRSYQQRHYPSILRQISVQVEKTPDPIKDFLTDSAVTAAGKQSGSGINVSAPLPMVQSKQVKGVRVDRAGHIVADSFFRVKGFDNVICLDGPDWMRSNILKIYQTFGKKISGFVEGYFEDRGISKIHFPENSLLLRSEKGNLALIGKMKSKNIRAALIAKIEKTLHA